MGRNRAEITGTFSRHLGSTVASACLALTLVSLVPQVARAAGTIVRRIPNGGVSTLRAAPPGVDGLEAPEIDPGPLALKVADGPVVEGAGQAGAASATDVSGPAGSTPLGAAPAAAPLSPWGGRLTNRSFARHKGNGQWVKSHDRARNRPELALSFDGLNFRDQRLAAGGNQFSVEPPDQGLCVGNGFVLETVNDVLRVFDTSGKPLTGPTDLNSFYGYLPAIVRATQQFGPEITDPSCYYDADTQRWFHVALTLDRVGTTSALSGTNHLDVAVSTTSSPLGAWNIYRVPVQDDGTDGTPVHASCPCLGDYPHIGADAHGFYITTNEFPLAGGFNSAQIYAISKDALVKGVLNLTVAQIDTLDHPLDGNPGFTVWPAISPAGDFERAGGGTEYFLSSLAVFNDSGTDTRLRMWALGNTASLSCGAPDLTLVDNVITVAPYGVPPLANQRAGDIPLGECINDTLLPTPLGPGCWRLLFAVEPGHAEVLSPIDANDSRMQQVTFADGKLYGALDTVTNVGASEQAGIAYYVIRPQRGRGGSIGGLVKQQGTIGLAANNLIYPAIAASDGKAVMSFTLVGADHYPSAAYVTVDPQRGAGPIQIAADGAGPQDGLTSYLAFTDGGDIRPRWGDYGAAVSDGKFIWVASEYIGQACTLGEYVTDPFGTCGGTRAALGNWGTRISKIKP
jgi:hypothetical protein